MISPCVMGSWRNLWAPHLFEFSFSGWLLIGFYVVVIAICARRSLLEADSARFWSWVAMALALFLVVRLLNLPDLATLAARCDALADGWYRQRRPAQVFIVAAFGLCALAAAIFAALSRAGITQKIAAAALLALFLFVMARTVSLHALDSLLGTKLGGGHLNGAVEAAALGAIAFAALSERRSGIRRFRSG